ncbi:MAG: Ezrin/radixin/moesin family protein [Cyclobacteriaceae bacterium]
MALTLCVSFAFNATAQMSKKEAKEWKKRIKALSPEQYKTLIEENKSLKSQTSSLKNELSTVDSRIADKDDQISQYESQIATLRDQVAAAKKATASKPAPKPAGAGSAKIIDGVVFKVQIGAYAKKDLKQFDSADNFSQESNDGVNKFTIGAFRDYWEADKLKKYLREMGVKGAFIVSYKDGQRVDIKEVLEGVSKS